jgi:hypothetical protein
MREAPASSVQEPDKTCDSIAQYSKKDAQIPRDRGRIRRDQGWPSELLLAAPAPEHAIHCHGEQRGGLAKLRDYKPAPADLSRKISRINTCSVRAVGRWVARKPDAEGMGATFYIMVPAVHYFETGDSGWQHAVRSPAGV